MRIAEVPSLIFGLPRIMRHSSFAGTSLSHRIAATDRRNAALARGAGARRSHRRFFDDLQSKYLCGDFLFVHAGVRPGIPLGKQKEEDLLWIRDEFLSSDKNFGKFIVHG